MGAHLERRRSLHPVPSAPSASRHGELLEPRLCRRELLERHPYAWYVEIDGLVLDARALPADLKDDARRRGLIPDLIADRAASSGY